MRTTMHLAILAILVLAVAPAMTAAAQPGGERLERLRAADTDGDGRVSFEEFMAAFPNATRKMFDRLDTNKDGFLCPQDFRGGVARERARPMQNRQRMLKLLREADVNGDGKVTYEEIIAVRPDFPRETFDRLDRNGDGVLSRADLLAHARDRVLGNEQRRAAMIQRLKHADTDGDGRISFEEFVAAFPNANKRVFDRLDINGDGVLCRKDIAEAREARRAQ